MNRACSVLALATVAALAGTAQSAPLTVSSYDMANGSGQANGGQFNYWDLPYNGAGLTTLDGAPLTGGTGDLTDGITTGSNWFAVENAGGTGPYVGWRALITPNPVVKFNFAGPVLVSTVTVHLDDSNGAGGVAPPLSIDVSADGVNFTANPITDPADGAPFAVTLPVNLAGSSIFVRFSNQIEWVFIDEVSFDGRVIGNAPAPLTPALLGLGLAALGIARSRR